MRDYPVPFESWKIGMEFWMPNGRWRVTDVGQRTIVAIKLGDQEIVVMDKDGNQRIEMSDDESWFNGPPYAVSERVIDEYSLQVCTLEKPDAS